MNGSDAIPSPLAHAYIITGGNGEARSELARRLTMAYLCEGTRPPCGKCRHCVKAERGIHPDVLPLSPAPDKRDIVVEQARALRADAWITPNEARRKVYPIFAADSMNEAAQNALLKVLEDGPAYAAFLLLCAQPGRLLETIRSRCETITLPPAGEEADPALAAQAGELARLLLEGSEAELWACLCALERSKIKASELQGLLALTEEALRPFLPIKPRRCAHLLRLLRRCREACAFHVGTGHLLGLLCAEREAGGKSRSED